MANVVGYYFLATLLFHPVEEIYTCNHPNTLGTQNLHLLCDWEDEDFIVLKDKTRVLRPVRKIDNPVKAYYRKKYWYEKTAKNRHQ